MPKVLKVAKTQKNEKKLSAIVYDVNGKKEASVELPKTIFAVKTNVTVLTHYIRVYLANQRHGTASTKTRGEVVGSTRKIYRQKGTGRARHGDIKAPIFIGGGTVGGPKPKDYSLKLNHKQKKLALFTSLSLKAKENNIFVLSKDAIDKFPKTKVFSNFLRKIDCLKTKNLLVFSKLERSKLILAVRNIPNISIVQADLINPYLIIKNEKIFFIGDSLEIIKKHFN